MRSSAGTVAAVDLGATSGRVIVGHVGPDTLDTEQTARFPNVPVRVADGIHWDILGLYGATLLGLRDAFRDHPGIASVGVDSWAVDYGLLRGGRLLGEPFHYRDERTARGVERVHGVLSHAELYEQNGLQFLPFNTLYQLASEPEEQLAFADTALLVPDLIGYWLTGVARAELTNASTTGLLDWPSAAWSDDLLRALGFPPTLLPGLIAPGATLGPLLPSVATSVHASDAVAVTAVGSHDTASAVVAVPMDAGSAAYISCGTWGLVGVEVERPVITAEGLAENFTNEGGVDGRVRLLRNVMGLWVLTETVREWAQADGADPSLTALLAQAAEVPDAPVFDIDDDRFLPPGGMVARIDSWFAERGLAPPSSRPVYVRSIIESLAQAFADTALLAGRIGGVDLSAIHLVGGGAQGDLLCQRVADRAGLPIVAGPVEATALGNLLVQARAAGFVPGSLEALRDLVSRTHSLRRFTPTADGHVV